MQKLSEKLKSVISHPQYIKEKWEHDRYCNGEGEILEISAFYPFPSRYRPCRYCERLEAAKQKRVSQVGETA